MPPFSYYGGKVGLSRLIVGLLPAHHTYIEPYLGSGAVLLAKARSRHEIVNDLDGALTTFWRMLRDRPTDLERVCALTPYARAEFAAADLDADVDELELARRFFVRVSQSFGKSAGPSTGWSVTTARTQSTAVSALTKVARFATLARRLAGVVIECCDAPGLIVRLATCDTVVYVDPPYVTSTRSARGGNGYRHEVDDDHHVRLAGVLHDTPATVILSGYTCPLYEEMYAGWWRHEIPVRVHASNAVTAARAARTEVLWSNRELAHASQLEFAVAAPPPPGAPGVL
ncbi:MAG TPA: DNA adenine methylase [Nitriliruptorales bacterium]